MVSSVSPEAKHTPATVMTVSRELPAPPVSDSSLLWRAPEGPEGTAVPVGAAEPGCGARGRRWGPAAVPVGGGVRLWCPWAVTGPSRGAGGWRQGQGGPRDRPLRAAGSRVAISRAGRRPPAHTAAGPHKASQRSARNTSGATSNTTTGTTPTHPGIQKTDIRDRMSACGGARGIRTPDLLIANETRYQLRHSPKDSNSLAPSQSATQADHRRVRHDTEPTHATAPRARRPAARHHNDSLVTGRVARPGRHPGRGRRPDRRQPRRWSGHPPGQSGRSGGPGLRRRCAGCRAGRYRHG